MCTSRGRERKKKKVSGDNFAPLQGRRGKGGGKSGEGGGKRVCIPNLHRADRSREKKEKTTPAKRPMVTKKKIWDIHPYCFVCEKKKKRACLDEVGEKKKRSLTPTRGKRWLAEEEKLKKEENNITTTWGGCPVFHKSGER